MLFYSLISYRTIATFNMHYHTKFQDLALSSASVAVISKAYGREMTNTMMMFILPFMKVQDFFRNI